MGNTDSVPVVSQMKSLVQYAGGNATAARITQENFAYRNTFPVISQIASAGYAIGGDMDEARDLQEKFAQDMLNVIDSIPVAGHVKGAVHYAMGENKEGEEAMKAASRSTGVLIGGVGGFAAGGPVGAVAGGIAGGAAADGIITGSDMLAKGDKGKPYGYVKVGDDIAEAIKGRKKITTEEGFDMALGPISDGLGGYGAGKYIGKPLGLDVGGGKVLVGGVPKGTVIQVLDEAGVAAKNGVNKGGAMALDNSVVKIKPVGKADVAGAAAKESGDVNFNKWGLDKAALDNRANQLNPNHPPSGPGRPAGYKGAGTKVDLDNHANQLNPEHPAYAGSRGNSAINSRNG